MLCCLPSRAFSWWNELQPFYMYRSSLSYYIITGHLFLKKSGQRVFLFRFLLACKYIPWQGGILLLLGMGRYSRCVCVCCSRQVNAVCSACDCGVSALNIPRALVMWAPLIYSLTVPAFLSIYSLSRAFCIFLYMLMTLMVIIIITPQSSGVIRSAKKNRIDVIT